MSILLAVVLASAPLTVSIDSPQKHVFVGEPWKLVVTWTAGPMRIADLLPENAEFERGSLVFHVDDGSGERIYMEGNKSGVIKEEIVAGEPLPAGERLVRNLVLQGGWYGEPGSPERQQGSLFPHAGRYTVRAEQRSWALVAHRGRGVPVSSRRILVEVKEPPEGERHVLDWLRSPRNAWVAMAGMGQPEVHELDRLIAENPGSRYLLWPRLRRIHIRSTAAPADTLGRERLDELRRSDPRALRRAVGEYFAGFTREATSFDGWGIYQEDALALALTLAAKAGDEAEQARIRAELLDRFPRSAAANELERERLAAQ
jgi:hypothetical protein